MRKLLNEYESFDKVITGIKNLKILKEKNPSKNYFIHFTEVPKIGINPKQEHSDPYGIYFYPDSFILDIEKWSDFQYAINYPYYYIVTLKPETNLLHTKNINEELIEEILGEKLFKLFNLLKIDFKGKLNKRFFSFLDMLNAEPSKRKNLNHKKIPKITWNKIFNKTNYDGIYDTKGLIAEGEPEQLVLFYLNKINVEDFGKSEFNYSENYKIIKGLMDKYNKPYSFNKFLNKEYIIGNDYYLLKKTKNNSVFFYYLDNDQLLRTKKFIPNFLDSFGNSLGELEYFIKNLNIKDLKYKLKNAKKPTKDKYTIYVENIVKTLIFREPKEKEIKEINEILVFDKTINVDNQDYLFYVKMEYTTVTLFISKLEGKNNSSINVTFKMGDETSKNISNFKNEIIKKYGKKTYLSIFKKIHKETI